MTLLRPFYSASALVAVLAMPAGGQQIERVTVPLTEPGRPAVIRVGLVSGSITVRGTNRRDVAIEAQSRGRDERDGSSPGAPTLRRLSQVPGFEVTEADNVITISSGSFAAPTDFTLMVPMESNLSLSTVNDGILMVDGVAGDIELQNTNGDVRVTNAAGSVVAQTVNGQVSVALTRVAPQKPMSFTTLNGNVDVTLPADTGATLKLRSDNGEVFTDFDVDVAARPATVAPSGRRDGQYRIEINRAVFGTINGGGPAYEVRTFNGNIYVRRATP